jgi:thioesterase domain-containing protein
MRLSPTATPVAFGLPVGDSQAATTTMRRRPLKRTKWTTRFDYFDLCLLNAGLLHRTSGGRKYEQEMPRETVPAGPLGGPRPGRHRPAEGGVPHPAVLRRRHRTDRAAATVRLASGTAATALVCFRAVVALSGPHQYARFAGALRGTRDVVAFPQPGFQPGTLLPAHLEAVVEAQTEAVRAYVDGAPVALLGYSSGGWVAHAVAERLQELGESPRAVVLLDTYVQDETGPETATAFTEGLFDRHGPAATADAASLTAMGAYFRVFEKWSPWEIAAPTLFLRATEALSEAGTSSRALTLGGRADRVLDVPGDHFTMLEEHAEQAARAVHTWLVEAAEEPRPGPATPKRSDRHV